MQLLKITVTGRVQGVSYRLAARHEAERLGLRGLARNQPDGTVYIEVEGEEPGLSRFLAWCQEGPDLAAVESVRHTIHPPVGHAGFSIG